MGKGLIHLYTGDGKGKTTASVGLSVRASGSGKRVIFAQFMKGADTSELKPLQQLGIQIIRQVSSLKFVSQMSEDEKKRYSECQNKTLWEAIDAAKHCDLLVLDEIVGAVTTGMIQLDTLLRFLRGKPDHLEVVLTGRDAPDALRNISNYLTTMQAEKHPYEEGINARKGIEF